MKKSEAVQHYGSERKISQVLGISHQAVNAWGKIVPIKKANKLEIDSGGKLWFMLEDYL